MSLLPLADGNTDPTACQNGSNSGAEAALETNPSEDVKPLTLAPTADSERVTTGSLPFGSPAWCFFGVPGGSSNIQRELVVTCTLCKAKVRRGINPGKVGTTCLLTHLERRHGMTRQEVYEQAMASGYSGLSTVSAALPSDSGGIGGSLHSRAATKRRIVSPSPADDDDDDDDDNDDDDEEEEEERPKRQATRAPATSSKPSTTSSSQPDKQNPSGSESSAYRQALRERLLGSVHMFCEVCHALVLSGERSQNVRDLALETHFSNNHPQMFKLLKCGAARDVRLGGLGPFSALPSGSLPPSFQR